MQKTRDEELEMMNSPTQWPVFPLLPLIRRVERDGRKDKELGALHAELGATVLLGNIYSLDYQSCTEYISLEAVYNDGWRVD